MRAYLNAAVLSAVATGLAVLGLRAPDPLVAIAAIAAGTCLLAWLAAQASTSQESGLALANPAWALTLAGAGAAGASASMFVAADDVPG